MTGIALSPAQAADPVNVTLLATNDFHGRIQKDGSQAGAAILAGYVKQSRISNPNTIFAAAGDLIGASTFASFVAQDKPTIDALNEAGLDVSAVGNHEFDQGYDDLINRVMAPFDADTNPTGGAEWAYIGANVKMRASGDSALDPTYVQSFGEGASEVEVGFVGAVTEDLPSLVTPDGIAEIEVTDIPTAVNAEADRLKSEGVDVIVTLVHEGAPSTDCDAMDDDPTSKFGEIVTGLNDNVDAIVSGHTHLAYDCSFAVEGWSERAVTERPVVSAGQYGTNLNRLELSIDPETQDLLSVDTSIVPLLPAGGPAAPADPATAKIVQDAVDEAEVKGSVKIGELAGAFDRSRTADLKDYRGGESTLGNLVAEIQRYATRTPSAGGAQIAFMNPGGLRADLRGKNEGGYPADLTFKQGADVQPFANTLVNMDLTGSQLKTILEQQWQPAGSSRPFLRMGISKGFDYTYDPTASQGNRVMSMTLNGTPIRAAADYSVTVNSFLASGGDNFLEFANGAAVQDTGKTDLVATTEYLEVFASEPLPVDYSQVSVGVAFPDGAPTTPLDTGDTVKMDLSSLAMTGPTDVTDDEVTVSLDGTELGTFPVDNTRGTDLFDNYGTASVNVTIPDYSDKPAGLTVTGAATGTKAEIPLDFAAHEPAVVAGKVTADRKPKKVYRGKTRVRIKIEVDAGGEPAAGGVKVFAGGKKYLRSLKPNGKITVRLRPYYTTGKKRVRVKYVGNATTTQDTQIVKLYVRRNK
ncbi:bifunctional metallophosphatase/5'-nucleotidase [Nocardioides salsibiostraticola]